jgi:hypothetical protein
MHIMKQWIFAYIKVPQLSNMFNSLRCEINWNWPLLKWKSYAEILELYYFNILRWEKFLSCVIKGLTVVINFLVNIKGFTEITSWELFCAVCLCVHLVEDFTECRSFFKWFSNERNVITSPWSGFYMRQLLAPWCRFQIDCNISFFSYKL